jgi:centriolar protein POC1
MDNTVRLWLPNARGDSSVLKGHSATVRSVRFSPDGHTLLTASDDKSVKLWSLSNLRFQGSFLGHINWVNQAVFAEEGSLIASASDDRTVKLWDSRTKGCLHTFDYHTSEATSVAFHPNSTLLASASLDKSILIYDMRTQQLVQRYPDAHEAGVSSLSFHPLAHTHFETSNYLLSSSSDGNIKMWDISEGQLAYTLHSTSATSPTRTATSLSSPRMKKRASSKQKKTGQDKGSVEEGKEDGALSTTSSHRHGHGVRQVRYA